MDEKRILELALARVDAIKEQVLVFRTEVEYAVEQVVLVINRGKDGCPKYKIPLAELVEPEVETIPAEAEEAFIESEPEPKPKKVDATPGAKRLARERNVDLTTIKGSGQGGRIIKADVEAVIKEG